MNERKQLAAAADEFRQASHALEEQRLIDSYQRLQRIVEKKISTGFIGALAAIEEVFGELWGHGKDPSELTPEERYWRRKFHGLRADILDNGNGQIRAANKELEQYTVRWDGYQTNLLVNRKVVRPPEDERR